MATAALVISAITAVGSAVQQRKASKAQRKQNKIQNKIAAISRRRAVRKSIAERRIRTAELQSIGFQLGVAGGTAQLGAQAGVVSDVASTIGASNLQFTGQQALSSLSNRISSLQSSAATFGSISSLAGSFVGGAGSVGAQNREAVSGLFGFGD